MYSWPWRVCRVHLKSKPAKWMLIGASYGGRVSYFREARPWQPPRAASNEGGHSGQRQTALLSSRLSRLGTRRVCHVLRVLTLPRPPWRPQFRVFTRTSSSFTLATSSHRSFTPRKFEFSFFDLLASYGEHKLNQCQGNSS